jgi:hypothetical protein
VTTGGDVELVKLLAEAREVDAELAELQLIANASLIGSAERRSYSELQGRSDDAWMKVLEPVTANERPY